MLFRPKPESLQAPASSADPLAQLLDVDTHTRQAATVTVSIRMSQVRRPQLRPILRWARVHLQPRPITCYEPRYPCPLLRLPACSFPRGASWPTARSIDRSFVRSLARASTCSAGDRMRARKEGGRSASWTLVSRGRCDDASVAGAGSTWLRWRLCWRVAGRHTPPQQQQAGTASPATRERQTRRKRLRQMTRARGEARKPHIYSQLFVRG